jgi:tight adherence protein C
MTPSAIFSGLALGLGLSSIVTWWRGRTPSLAARVAPQLRPIGGWGPDGVSKVGRRGKRPRLLEGVLRGGTRVSERWGTPTTDLAARLRRAGSPLSVDQFRTEQVLWGVAGLVMGLVLSLLLVARGSSPVALTIMVGVAGLMGGAAREQSLARSVSRRESRILAELPAVADMLALAVSAGEGALGALERVTRGTSGVLASELRETLGEVRTGTPLAEAMHSLSERTGVAALSRFSSGVAVAVERGTPLVDVLHAQAIDVREAGRRRLIEEGGKREIAMMVPVIFLILPVTVVFAVFPGIVAIRIGI